MSKGADRAEKSRDVFVWSRRHYERLKDTKYAGLRYRLDWPTLPVLRYTRV